MSTAGCSFCPGRYCALLGAALPVQDFAGGDGIEDPQGTEEILLSIRELPRLSLQTFQLEEKMSLGSATGLSPDTAEAGKPSCEIQLFSNLHV
jgi:hypothetical protein